MVFPYPKGFEIINWWFSILFHISCVVIVFKYLWYYCSILYSDLWNLTIFSFFFKFDSFTSNLSLFSYRKCLNLVAWRYFFIGSAQHVEVTKKIFS
jgi:hypothetical protein